MSLIKKLTQTDHEIVKSYIYQNFWGCIEIAKVFDKNGLKNKLSDKNSGDFLGFFTDENNLEGIFVFTNNKRFLLHVKNNDVTKKVDLLKAIKYYKPEYMSGPSKHVEMVWQMFERTVKRYKYSNSMYMVLEDYQTLLDEFKENRSIREASKGDAKKQIKFFLELEKHFGRNHMTINQLQNRIVERIGLNEYLVIDDGIRIVAQGFVEDKIKAFSQIGGIYTTPKFRNNGFSRSIVEHLSYYTIQKGNIPILAVLKDNISAIKVYESLQFKAKVDFSIIELEF
ncbi:MAG: GNAT family N-acetyltransferase [Clostridiales bacterium]|nr:GNAT family N-acetyltransferase [Clostridiales bacterium]